MFVCWKMNEETYSFLFLNKLFLGKKFLSINFPLVREEKPRCQMGFEMGWGKVRACGR